MNMFRDIAILVLLALGIGLMVGDPENWTWVELGGSYALDALSFLIKGRPFSELICMVLALAMFMTRLKY
jgi:hypothetical protein